jgi:hypothetical protein
MSAGFRPWIGPLVLVLIGLAGVGCLLGSSSEAREIAVESAFLLFTVLTTPFVLETSVALFGLIAVLTYNQWRLSREGDEWVEMEVKRPVDQKTD